MAAFDFISEEGFATKRDYSFSVDSGSTDLGSSSSARGSEEEDVESDSDKPFQRSSSWSVVENCLEHLESVKKTARTWPAEKPVRCVTFGKVEHETYLMPRQASVRHTEPMPPQASVCHTGPKFAMCQDGAEDDESHDGGRTMTSESSYTMCGGTVARCATWNGFVCDERCGEAPIQHMRTGDEFDMSVSPDSTRGGAESRLARKVNMNTSGEGHLAQQVVNPMYPHPMFAMPVPGGMMPVTWNTAGTAGWNVVHVPHQPAPMYMASSGSFGWGFPHPGNGPAVPPSEAPRAPPTAQTQGVEQPTTVMLRNIPNNYDRDSFVGLLDSQGFSGQFDFLYLPLDFKSRVAVGYAFVNFTSHAVAVRALQTFSGFSAWKGKSRKVCDVIWSATHQGLEANIELVRNSPMNRRRVPEEFKPIIIKNGRRIKLPPPSKRS